MRIGILDYGCGNVQSVRNSLLAVGADSVCSNDKALLSQTDALILPGVGAFADAAQALHERGLWDFARDEAQRKPLLGICLGMQLLFEESCEGGVRTPGLALLRGSVELLSPPPPLKLPHMGWNELVFTEQGRKSPLFANIPENSYVYFVHSYAAHCKDANTLLASCEHGETVCAAAGRGTLFGCQFHPEKSGKTGLQILQNFCDTAGSK